MVVFGAIVLFTIKVKDVDSLPHSFSSGNNCGTFPVEIIVACSGCNTDALWQEAVVGLTSVSDTSEV